MDIARIVATFTAGAVLATACGGGSDTATTPATISGTPTTSTPTSPASSDDTEDASAGESIPATNSPPATDAPTTTVAADPEPDPFDLTTLPDLIAAADAAFGDATVDPFPVVDAIIGFPLPIPVPEGSALQRFDAVLSFVAEDGSGGWSARYDVVAPGGTVDDIDLDLDGNGPGTQQLSDLFDPIMTTLGFERKNSTASDPGEPGGPSSVNHVYVSADPEQTINGVAATLDPVFIWSTEDINGWAYDETLPQLGGYTVDVSFDAAAPSIGSVASTPFPIANSVIDAFPRPDGLVLSELSIRMYARSADSFSIDKGKTVLNLMITWEAPVERFDDIVAFYADPDARFSANEFFTAGEADLGGNGTIIPTEPYVYDGTDTRLEVLVMQRYGALFGIDASDDGIEPVEIRLDIELNPNDVLLTPPAD